MKAVAEWLAGLAVLADPLSAVRRASERPQAAGAVTVLLTLVTGLGIATLPRQLFLLHQALAPTGRLPLDLHHQALEAGLTRVILFDRLVPPPTVLVAGLLVALGAEPLLAYARDQRFRVRTVIALGLAPLVVQRCGELALSYILAVPTPPPPGLAIGLPQQFATGPTLLWSGTTAAWLEALSARANLVTLWSLGIWTVGLRELDGGRLRAWHVALPALCLAGAGLLTWSLGPSVLSLILGRP